MVSVGAPEETTTATQRISHPGENPMAIDRSEGCLPPHSGSSRQSHGKEHVYVFPV